MSFSTLPFELKELIVDVVDAQDRQLKAFLKQNQAVTRRPTFASSSAGLGWANGLRTLSLVSHELRDIALPYVFRTLKVSTIDRADCDNLLSALPAQACRAVRIDVFGNTDQDAHSLLFALDLLTRLLKVEEVRFYTTRGALDALQQLFSELPYKERSVLPGSFSAGRFIASAPDDDPLIHPNVRPCASHRLAAQLKRGAIPGFKQTLERLKAWSFGPLAGSQIAPLLTLFSPNLRNLTLLGLDTPCTREQLDSEDGAGWKRFIASDTAGGYLSQRNPQLRTALAECEKLESLEIHAKSVEDDSVIHDAWLDHSFPFASTLTSLTIVSHGFWDLTTFAFAQRFPSLRQLVLVANDMEPLVYADPQTLSLPSLVSLTLRFPYFKPLDWLIDRLKLPTLSILTVSIEMSLNHNDPEVIEEFLRVGRDFFATPSFRTFQLESHGSYILPPSLTRRLRKGLAPYGVSVETGWTLDDEQEEKPALDKAEELLSWAAEYAARLRVEGGELGAETLLSGLGQLEGLREMVEK
ncbi:hypothetical protein JCM11641_000807 [Rhodosporidiobolus odoratus]